MTPWSDRAAMDPHSPPPGTSQPRPDHNYEIIGLPGEIVIKDSYWVRLQDGAAGNAIDFLVHVEGMTFNNAMSTLQDGLPTPS